MGERTFYVYILGGESAVLYVGVTRDIVRRMVQHRARKGPGFAAKYNVARLVYYEIFAGPRAAIAREKQIKGWVRKKKISLIERANPSWRDLSEDFN
jgi:putative endonuclease